MQEAQETQVPSLGLEEAMATPVFLRGNFHGRRSLVGYSLWDHKESDTTEVTEQACVPNCGCTFCLKRTRKFLANKSQLLQISAPESGGNS